MLLLPQTLGENATLYVELEYKGHILKRSIDFNKKEWKPGKTITYRLNNKLLEIPTANLELIDENGLPLKEIKVGYAGGETDYKVNSYMNIKKADGSVLKLPMPWKASIVERDGNGNENTIISYKITGSSVGQVSSITKIVDEESEPYRRQFGSIQRIEYDYYNEDYPAKLADLAPHPVKTLVMVPKVVMTTTTPATSALRSAGLVGSEDAPYNLAARGIGLAKNGLQIFHKNGMGVGGKPDEWTDFLTREYRYTDDYYGEKDINTANCYIVSAPGWYSFPLVYGNAVKDGCVNYSAFVFKSDNQGNSSSSTSASLKGENRILRYAINHAGNDIKSPYILDGNSISSSDNLEAKLLWEDQICLIDDVSLVDVGDQTQTLDEFYSMPPDRYKITETYKPQKKIRFQIKQDNIRQGNAVIVLKEKDTTDKNGNITKKGTVLWSWHIWVTPDGTGTASNYHPISHKSTIYGRLFEEGKERTSWTEKHNHYLYNRCIGMVMSGDKYEFTPPNVYIKYEPLYEVMQNLLQHSKSLFNKSTNEGGYGLTRMDPKDAKEFVKSLKDYYDKHPVYVKVSQDNFIDEVDEDYYMLYQWGRKDPMISRFEHVFDGNHIRIDPTDKRHMGDHVADKDLKDHKAWIMYGIQHPDECMFDGSLTSGEFYANLWNFSLGTDEINCMYPGPTDEHYNETDFYVGDWWMGHSCILRDYYIPSDRVFKSVYDPSPVGQKMPVGPVLNLLSINTNGITQDAGENGTWYKYSFGAFTGFGYEGHGIGGTFAECLKGEDGKYITPLSAGTQNSFWIPAFGYRYGDGFTKRHNLDFAIWEGGAPSKEGNGRVLHGTAANVIIWGGDKYSHFNIYCALPVLPMFEEPQWLRTF